MSTQYTLKVKNSSDSSKNVRIYQTKSDQSLSNTQSIFEWFIDHNLFWTKAGILMPGRSYYAMNSGESVQKNVQGKRLNHI